VNSLLSVLTFAPLRPCVRFSFVARRAVGLAEADPFVSLRVPLRVHSRSLFGPIRSALPVGYAVLIEMDYEEPLLGKRSVEGNKLLGFA
jgi:hypothetical protein